MTDKPTVKDLIRSPVLAVAFGFGAGLVPRAPGTVGTLLAIPIWWVLAGVSSLQYLVATGLLFCVGVWVCSKATSVLTEHDHPGIVVDEIVGYMAALAVVPAEPFWIVCSFIMFRGFDILKPWPIGWLDQNLRGGFGVMFDDLAAGIFTGAVILLLRQWSQGL